MLLMHTSHRRFIIRIMQRVGQSMISICNYRKVKWASNRDADYKEAQIYRIIDRYMDLFERNVAEMCMHPRAQCIWHFINM